MAARQLDLVTSLVLDAYGFDPKIDTFQIDPQRKQMIIEINEVPMGLERIRELESPENEIG